MAQEFRKYCCIVDASWKSSDTRAGIGWQLYNPRGCNILRDKSSISPTSTPYTLRKLSFENVVILRDCKTLFDDLASFVGQQAQRGRWINSSIATQVKDIANLLPHSGQMTFKHVKRSVVTEVDRVAKIAREQSSPYIVTWVMM
ncbi:hypothetical protein EUTSA_v10009928mg [Eutrema salsugineum]|uniref:RNase H type-1 domain-containing protein n=1 Tax=Eutrema salsugineum TaxID=72664 RepID=V4L1H6_EUTSA|nr:hypothetical protein EUTSA_v10009928mg [Eutrema salsugineum]